MCEDLHGAVPGPGRRSGLIGALKAAATHRNLVVHADWTNSDVEGYTFTKVQIKNGGMMQEDAQLTVESMEKVCKRDDRHAGATPRLPHRARRNCSVLGPGPDQISTSGVSAAFGRPPCPLTGSYGARCCPSPCDPQRQVCNGFSRSTFPHDVNLRHRRSLVANCSPQVRRMPDSMRLAAVAGPSCGNAAVAAGRHARPPRLQVSAIP